MKVVIDVPAGRLSIEGDGPDLMKVLEAARQLAPTVSQINIVTSGTALRDNGPEQPRDASVVHQSQGMGQKTLRQFVRGLNLKNISERIAAIAYYVNKIEGRQGFSPKE